MGNNDVFINEHDIIEIIVNGDQTVSSVQAMGDEAMRLAEHRKSKGSPVYILDNLLEIGDVPPEAFNLVKQLIASSTYDKFAMVGKHTGIRIGANLILKVTGKSRQVKYFEDYGRATRWLLAD
jgi:hypothetical protein